MNVFISKAKLIHPGHQYHNQKVDIEIKDGKIGAIGKNLKAKAKKVIKVKNLHVSAGWIDIGTQCGEPGFEQREDFASATNAAINGGFTALACFPNTQPVLQSKSDIKFIQESTRNNIVDFLPIGAVSKDLDGKEISDMIDMSRAGAIAFSDGRHSIQDSGLLLRSLEYVKGFGGLIIQRASDKNLEQGGMMHEGSTSVSLGMTGIPSLAEESALYRDLGLNHYAQSKICSHLISTKKSVENVKKAKRDYHNVFATVSYQNLIDNDESLSNFEINLKLSPPLRSESDRKALIKGLKSGVIDAICTNHEPIEEEIKSLEFAYSEFGATGIETCFAALNTYIENELPLEILITKLSTGGRMILDLPVNNIEVNDKANLTLFDPNLSWTYSSNKMGSKSKNNIFMNKKLNGKVIGIINNNKLKLAK